MRFAFFILWVLLALWFPGCNAAAPWLYAAPPPGSPEVYIVGHGWHAGIVFRREDVPEEWWPDLPEFTGARFLEVGWGDAGYYQDPDAGIMEALEAALWPTPSVLHVVGFSRPVDQYFDRREILRVSLTEAGMEDLVAYVGEAYALNEEGRRIPLGSGWYGQSRFYLARESYHLFNTCNVWVARALRAAGCPIVPAGALTVENLFVRVLACGEVVQNPETGSLL